MSAVNSPPNRPKCSQEFARESRSQPDRPPRYYFNASFPRIGRLVRGDWDFNPQISRLVEGRSIFRYGPDAQRVAPRPKLADGKIAAKNTATNVRRRQFLLLAQIGQTAVEFRHLLLDFPAALDGLRLSFVDQLQVGRFQLIEPCCTSAIS